MQQECARLGAVFLIFGETSLCGECVVETVASETDHSTL